MYSRYSNSSDKPIRVPEHYSGCAFSDHYREELSTRSFGVAKPSPPPQETPISSKPQSPMLPLPNPEIQSAPEKPCDPPQPSAKDPSHDTSMPSPFKPLLDALGKGLHFSKGLEFDQLLILGLILLLSHSEEDADIVLWLGLLLLCG